MATGAGWSTLYISLTESHTAVGLVPYFSVKVIELRDMQADHCPIANKYKNKILNLVLRQQPSFF